MNKSHHAAPVPLCTVKDSIDPRRTIVWDDSDRWDGSKQILVGFRKLDDVTKIKKEFTAWQYAKSMVWLNGLAVGLTRPYGAVSPNGDMCHAEMMIQVRKGEWARFSINKKQYIGRDDNGNPEFEWGRVHATVMGNRESEWRKKYCFLQFELKKRECVKETFKFLISQESAPFNYWGYMFNNFCFCSSIGIGHYSGNLEASHEKWFCTEIIHAALQCAADSDIVQSNNIRLGENTWQHVVKNYRCCKTNPNWMFDKLSKCHNVTMTLAPNSQSNKYITIDI